MLIRNQLPLLVFLLVTLAVAGCGGDEAYKLEPKPDVDYQALEKAASADEDVSKADVRALEK